MGGGGVGVCKVSDDTGGVIPPTSASNLQHEKDSVATPYLPPAILYCPHPAPYCSPNPNQTLYQVTTGFHHNFQSNIQKSPYLFISAAVVWASTSQEFHSRTACFPLACYSSLFVKQWLNGNGDSVADSSHFLPVNIAPASPSKKGKSPDADSIIRSADRFSKPGSFPSWGSERMGLWSVDIRPACGDFPMEEDCRTRGKYLSRGNWNRNNTAATALAPSGWATRGCEWLKHGCNLFKLAVEISMAELSRCLVAVNLQPCTSIVSS